MAALKEPRVEWHSTEEDGGPDVGISFIVDEKRHVWCGEIPRRRFEDGDAEALGSDIGWFIVLYDETQPSGGRAIVLAKAADQERGTLVARLMALALANGAMSEETRDAR